jgi:hypothetical protein
VNIAANQISSNCPPIGIAFSSHRPDGRPGTCNVIHLPSLDEIIVGQYRIQLDRALLDKARNWVKYNNRIRSPRHETGGLLWGLWDEAINVIWIFDLSGPPVDSAHDPGHFICGIEGTTDEHNHRLSDSRGTGGFIGFWHTHPDMPSGQSRQDIGGMARLVARIGQNQRRALMLIFGRTGEQPTAALYAYESLSVTQATEFISAGLAQFPLDARVV